MDHRLQFHPYLHAPGACHCSDVRFLCMQGCNWGPGIGRLACGMQIEGLWAGTAHLLIRLCSVGEAAAMKVRLVLLSLLIINERCWYSTARNASAVAADGNELTFIQNATSSPPLAAFDYIVVGGGATGCPLAVTLSRHFKVLLLERGGFRDATTLNETGFGTALVNTNNSTSPVEVFMSEDGVPNQRARTLGGGTSINAGFYTRASPQEVFEAGWDGRLANDSYQWVENVVAFFPKLGVWQSALRQGLLEENILPDNGFTFDEVTGTKVGGSLFDAAGNRHSAVDFILQYANPDNITVLIFATVERILFRASEGGVQRPVTDGVEYTDMNGLRHRATLISRSGEGDVILCAGAVGSPQLLLLSGVGPAEQLSSFKIPLVLDLPGVGKGMADNPTVRTIIPLQKPVDYSLVQVAGKTTSGAYIEGASAGDFDFILGLIRALTILPPSQRQNPVVVAEILSQVRNFKAQINALSNKLGVIVMKIVGPFSQGQLVLRSADVRENPSVTFNYLSEPEDINLCLEGVQALAKVVQSQAVRNLSYADEDSIPSQLRPAIKLVGNTIPQNVRNATATVKFCKDTVSSLWHYHGGCQVGSVVDSKYRVLGLNRLRVVDGSTFSFTPGANPQATNMMLGRYMGVQILEDRCP